MLVNVMFKGNNTKYCFECFDKVELGQYVVVDTKYGFALGVINDIDVTTTINASKLKEVVSVVDTKAYEERKSKREQIQKLKKRMDSRVKELQDIAVYTMLAKEDSELEKLLSEYQQLSK